jgi:ribosome-associated protein
LISRDFSSEFSFQASRSSGAGGQNVNKVNSRIELRFSITNSLILSDEEKAILFAKLSSKLTDDGTLIITSQVSRSQLENKELCIEKFYQIIEKALIPKKPRRPTKPTAASKRKRLDEKKGNSEKKQMRRKPL